MVQQFFHELWNDEGWATINSWEAKTEGKFETNKITIPVFSTRVLDGCFKHVTSFNSIFHNSYEKVYTMD